LDWPKPNYKLALAVVDESVEGEHEGEEEGIWSMYLLQFQWSLDLWYVLVDPALEGLEVDGLPNFACHGVC
jgi:hypothetical protein